MKVLWLTNVILPDIAKSVDASPPISGGWLDLLSENIRMIDEVSLYVCFPCNTPWIKYGMKINEVIVYPFNRVDNLDIFFERVLDDCKPDIINIFGTERKHALNMITSCKNKGLLSRTVVTIQGLISLCSKHYCDGLPLKTILFFSFRDLLKWDSILLQKKKYAVLGKQEKKVLREVNNIIGRTEYDYAYSMQINPSANYYTCNEILRESFYKNKWDFERCEKHTIFVSASSYPLKGFHVAIEALKIIVNSFPDTKLYTTGKSPINISTKEKVFRTHYHAYIGELIRKYHLSDNIIFLGNLDEVKMCEAFLRSNVFASCSSVENSSNAICEAMLLGVPSVVSDVGGTSTLLKHESEGYIYQFGEEHMLAHYIIQLFDSKLKCVQFSNSAREKALIRHNRKQNTEDLLKIYNSLMNSSKEDKRE